MKDNNLYKIVAEYNAKTGSMTISVFKNGIPVNFDKLPKQEQNKITALSAQSYVYLDEKNNKIINPKN